MYRSILAKAAASGTIARKNGGGMRLYFVGIGGGGMYPLARLAAVLGYRVSGTDARESENTRRLEREGIFVRIGTSALPQSVDALVHTLAVARSHPLLLEAEKRGIPIFTRTELLALLERRFPTRVAVAGSHGKSSTVGMCAAILREAGIAHTVLCGAELTREDGGFLGGGGEVLLYEACEYKDAFLDLSPTHAAVLNAEWEHADFFPSEDAALSSFRRFLGKNTLRFRACHASLDFPSDLSYGDGARLHAEALREKNGCFSFSLLMGEERLCDVSLGVIGAFQVQNALAAAALALSVGAGKEAVMRGLAAFRGVACRMEYKGRVGASALYLDYAHHPTELSAALKAARGLGEKVVCVFEPHTYSRVFAFEDRFLRLFSSAVFGILPIYAAREENIYGVSSARLAEKSGATFLKDYASAAAFLEEKSGDETVLLLVGAGTVGETLRYLTNLTE